MGKAGDGSMIESFSDDVKATVHNIKDDITEINGTLR